MNNTETLKKERNNTNGAKTGHAESLRQLAHQMNNVLATILGYSDILEAEIEPTAAQQRAVERIRQAVRRGTDLTSRLVEISKNAASSHD